MKIKNTFISAGIYFCYVFGSCILSMLVESLFLFLLDKFVLISYPVQTVIRIVIHTALVASLMGLFGYAEGYREARCSVTECVASNVLAMILHLLFSMLFKFQAFVSGAVRFTAGFIYNGLSITYESLINKTPYHYFLLTFAAYGALYTVVLTACKHLGAKKRLNDGRELTQGNT